MRRKRIISLLLASFIFASVPQANPIADTTIIAQAHGGRTDSRGGHKDNKNASGLGSYHYHCGGYPAHLHSNGVCPYQLSDSTSSGTSAKTSADTSAKTSTSASPATETPQVATAQQMTPGWHKDETGWKYYYADSTCAKSKWELINQIYYCFDDRGYLYVNTYTPDGYWVNENGEWKE